MATYDKMTSPNGRKIQVESAIRDGEGKNILNNYAKQDGAYENLWAGNLITDTNWRWINDFKFGTGSVDTVFYGEATLYSIRGITEWDGSTPKYVNVVSNKSVIFNLYNPTLHYAHVVKSNNENNGLCVYGKNIEVGTIIEFSETSDFASITEIALTEETNSMGDTYLHCNVPNDGYVRVKNAEPSNLCISNVWGGNRVNYVAEYEESVISVNSATYFPSGMKGITVNGDNTACYDEIFANRYYARCLSYSFGATPSVSYVAASGSFNIYRMSLSNAMSKGACEIGNSTKFAWLGIGAMSSSNVFFEDSMSLYTNYIYFAIKQSEDSTYTYSEDTDVVDETSFESELASKGSLFVLVDGEYVSATTYTSGETYYYISATDLHGLNGKAIKDEIANKHIVYQRYSMDKSVYAGSAISPALNWSYKVGDFGTEELTLASGFPVVPRWAVYYPVNAVEAIQQLPNNYVSLESAEKMLHQVGAIQGFDFDNIEVDSETGNMKVNGLIDTKDTIVNLTTKPFLGTYGTWLNLNDADKETMKKIFTQQIRPRFLIVYQTPWNSDGEKCSLSCISIANINSGGIAFYKDKWRMLCLGIAASTKRMISVVITGSQYYVRELHTNVS